MQNHPLDVERIVRAAIWHAGRTYSVAQPGRHHDVFRSMEAAGHGDGCLPGEQGFATNKGRFVDRREGMQIAFDAGQLLQTKDCNGVPFTRESDTLFSEDVW